MSYYDAMFDSALRRIRAGLPPRMGQAKVRKEAPAPAPVPQPVKEIPESRGRARVRGIRELAYRNGRLKPSMRAYSSLVTDALADGRSTRADVARRVFGAIEAKAKGARFGALDRATFRANGDVAGRVPEDWLR